MIRKAFSWILMVLVWSSCTEEEVVPRTNPRFSVALIQSIGEEGAEFSANVYDFGSEEILEYGFAFGKNPRIDDVDTEVISQQGKPGSEFSMQASKGLKKGERYVVAAFLKTESGTVYSEGTEFTSQGSLGFILEGIDAPEEVYFESELIFRLKNLPRNLSKVKVFFEGYDMPLQDLTDKGFKIKLPERFEFDPERAKDNRFLIKIKTPENELEVEKILNFKKPVFSLSPSKKFNYSDTLQINGLNLREIAPVATYENKVGQVFALDLFAADDQSIKFRANAFFTEDNPKIKVKIRGIEYELSEQIRLNPTEINPGQALDYDGGYRELFIEGKNFNPFDPSFNRLVLQGTSYHIVQVMQATADRLKVEIIPRTGTFDRTISIYTQMGPGNSQNGYRLNVTIPELPYLELPFGILGGNSSIGVSYQDKGYVVGSNGIFEFSDDQKPPVMLLDGFPYFGSLPVKYVTPGAGVLYISDGYRLYSFNLISKSVEQLPDLPNPTGENLGFFVEQGFLYTEYGDQETNTFTELRKRRFRLNLSSKVWETLPASPAKPFFICNKTFRLNGQLYAYRIAISDSGSKGLIERFNPQTADWTVVNADVNDYVYVVTNEIYVINDQVFFPADVNSFVWNTQTGDFKFVENYPPSWWAVSGFRIKDKFYQFNSTSENTVLMQVDPKYFTFKN